MATAECGSKLCSRLWSKRWQPAQFSARQLQVGADIISAHGLFLRRPRSITKRKGWLTDTRTSVVAVRAAVRDALPLVCGPLRPAALKLVAATALPPADGRVTPLADGCHLGVPRLQRRPLGSDDDFVGVPPPDRPPPSLMCSDSAEPTLVLRLNGGGGSRNETITHTQGGSTEATVTEAATRGRASVRVCGGRRVSRGAPVESVWRSRWVVQRSAGGVSRMLTC